MINLNELPEILLTAEKGDRFLIDGIEVIFDTNPNWKQEVYQKTGFLTTADSNVSLYHELCDRGEHNIYSEYIKHVRVPDEDLNHAAHVTIDHMIECIKAGTYEIN